MKFLKKKKYQKLLQADQTLEELFQVICKGIEGHEYSKSQLGQDLIALLVNSMKKNGYFVEFGATNGFDLSNTYLLEKFYGWDGILVEPVQFWHEELLKNRECIIDLRCVTSTSGQLIDFIVAKDPELSTIFGFEGLDNHANSRKNSEKVSVQTVSLTDLLQEYSAPEQIDYLSIDTEGSEFDILKGFNFSKYRFNFISVEHNYTNNRLKLNDLLTTNGYRQILPALSKFDDWYIYVN